MEEKDIWADLFAATKRVDDAKIYLESAYSERDKEIATLYKSGMPPATIARRLGLNHSTIHKVLKQQGAK